MTSASRELCEELFEISGWTTEEFESGENGYTTSNGLSVPVYDLGYLLEKLPKNCHDGVLSLQMASFGCVIGYAQDVSTIIPQYAKIPEDAACKLAIDLFKQGVVKR